MNALLNEFPFKECVALYNLKHNGLLMEKNKPSRTWLKYLCSYSDFNLISSKICVVSHISVFLPLYKIDQYCFNHTAYLEGVDCLQITNISEFLSHIMAFFLFLAAI
uniref:Uncharacterized protein n=1 Tax=Micrurus spixii TaxID=129469 RepID=A0A2D4N8Z2_9SAUR